MTDPVEQIRQWAKDAHERYGTIGLCPYRHGTASAEEEAAEKSHAAAAVVVAAGNRAERDIRADGGVASYEVYFVKGAVYKYRPCLGLSRRPRHRPPRLGAVHHDTLCGTSKKLSANSKARNQKCYLSVEAAVIATTFQCAASCRRPNQQQS
jgi:hypothetical protein